MPKRSKCMERLQEYSSSAGATLGLDRDAGIIRGVKTLGLESKNGRSYPRSTLEKAVQLYDGAKVNVNHASGPRDYRDRMGSLHNPRIESDGIYTDFHFNPKHQLAEQICWDAEHAPENVGFSHVVDAKVARKNGKIVVEEIISVVSVDLVADPATTNGLFESTAQTQESSDMDLKDLTIEQLREARQDLVDILQGKDVVTKLSTELASAKESLAKATDELTALKAKEAVQARTLAIAEELNAAKLDVNDKKVVSDVFMASLVAAESADARKSLIDDRLSLLRERVQPITGTPPMAAITDAPAQGAFISVKETMSRL